MYRQTDPNGRGPRNRYGETQGVEGLSGVAGVAQAPKFTVTVDGADKLRRNMDGAVNDLEDLSSTNREVAQRAASGARSRAPVDTGELRGSLTGEANETTATVRATARHAGPIHWGVPSKSIAPNPFITAAMVADESTFVDLYRRRLDAVTNDMAG